MTQQEIEQIPIAKTIDWKFGLITYQLYRHTESKMIITDTSGGWYDAPLTIEEFKSINQGTKELSSLDWD